MSLTEELAGVYISRTFSKPSDSRFPIFRISITMIVGRIEGRVTWKACWKRFAPSMRAASYRSSEMPAMAATYTMALQPVYCHASVAIYRGRKYSGSFI